MYGRSRAEREWMADVAAQMIRDELLGDEEEEQEPKQVECKTCDGVGMVERGEGDDTYDEECPDCEGTGLVDEED